MAKWMVYKWFTMENPNLKRMMKWGYPPPTSGNLKVIIFRQLHEVDTAMGGVWVFGQLELSGFRGCGAAQGLERDGTL